MSDKLKSILKGKKNCNEYFNLDKVGDNIDKKDYLDSVNEKVAKTLAGMDKLDELKKVGLVSNGEYCEMSNKLREIRHNQFNPEIQAIINALECIFNMNYTEFDTNVAFNALCDIYNYGSDNV